MSPVEGGTIDGQDSLSTSAEGNVQFSYQAGPAPGRYRVLVRSRARNTNWSSTSSTGTTQRTTAASPSRGINGEVKAMRKFFSSTFLILGLSVSAGHARSL